MAVIVSKTNELCKKSMSDVYYGFLSSQMAENEKLLHVDADVGLSIVGKSFFALKEKFPKQVIDCGIQECNMVGVAAGFAACGKIPFAHAFAPFVARRAADQIFVSGAYSNSNIKLLGSDPGIMATFNGGTHMPFEDVAYMRAIPNMTIVEPSDSILAEAVLHAAVEQYGMFYIRYARKQVVQLYEEGSTFTIGKGNVIRDGRDVTIIACGIMVEEGLAAVKALAEKGISARLVDMFTIKPVDQELILKCAAETGAIVTAENHSVINGLGAAVADVLMENRLVPLEKVGVQDRFGQVGAVPFLKKEYGLTAEDIVKKAERAIQRKK